MMLEKVKLLLSVFDSSPLHFFSMLSILLLFVISICYIFEYKYRYFNFGGTNYPSKNKLRSVQVITAGQH